MEFFAGILGNLISELFLRKSDFLLKDLTDNISWKKWKAENELSKNQNDFLDRYAETLVFLKKENKPERLLRFYGERSVIEIIHKIWYKTEEKEITEVDFENLTRWFTLDQQLANFSPKDELTFFLESFGIAVHLNRTSGEAELFHAVTSTKKNVKELEGKIEESTQVFLENVLEIKSIILDEKVIHFKDFENIKNLIERRKELTILAQHDQSNKNYTFEINDIENRIRIEKEQIVKLANEIELFASEGLITKQIKEAREMILNGNFGGAKDRMIEMQQEEARIRFLFKLGVAPEYIDQIDFEIETGHVSSDGMVYYYIVNFTEDSPRHILEEIPGIEICGDQYYLEVEPWDGLLDLK